jgi:hypothetical protein
MAEYAQTARHALVCLSPIPDRFNPVRRVVDGVGVPWGDGVEYLPVDQLPPAAEVTSCASTGSPYKMWSVPPLRMSTMSMTKGDGPVEIQRPYGVK